MAPKWTKDEVAAMAPDAASAKAGAGLATPRKWVSTGGDDAAIWGECQGSGKDPYRTAVDLSDGATKCSCPSRKFPCKHAIGLMLIYAAGGVSGGSRPDFVTAWLDGRGAARQRKENAAAGAPPADPAAAEKRRAKRAAAMAGGAQEARLWLIDAVRGGTDLLRRRPGSHFSQTAARMIDAKAPGLAAAILRIGQAGTGDGWEARLLRELASLHLMLRRFEAASDGSDRAAAALLGEPVPREEVLASGPGEAGEWVALGHRTALEDLGAQGEMIARRIWLARRGDGLPALLLSYAHPKQVTTLDIPLSPGTAFEGELAYYPDGLRALIRRRGDDAAALPPALPPALPGLAAADTARRAALAANPWLGPFAQVVDGLDVRRDPQRAKGDGWFVADRDGLAVPLVPPDDGPWRLLAETAGRPGPLTLEWDGPTVRILAAWTPNGARHVPYAAGAAA